MLRANLHVAGVIILALAAVYPVYPRRLGWAAELERVSLLVRQVFFVHVGFIVMLLALQGLLLVAVPGVLLERSRAAAALLVGLIAFWGYRLIAQLLIFDRRLWMGDRLRTCLHVVFTVIWAYLTALFALALALH